MVHLAYRVFWVAVRTQPTIVAPRHNINHFAAVGLMLLCEGRITDNRVQHGLAGMSRVLLNF